MPLSPEELRLCRRMRTLMPDWEYYLWLDEDNEVLVRNHFPQHLNAYRAIQRGVVKADIVRYLYMAVFGGFYFDTDYKMLRKIDDSLLRHVCVLPVSRMDDTLFRLENAVLASEPGYRFWNDFLEHIFSQRENGGMLATLAEDRVEKVTGPEGLTEFYLARKERYAEAFLPQPECFHPKASKRGLVFKKTEATLGAHLCWGSWRSKGTLHRAVDAMARQIGSIV